MSLPNVVYSQRSRNFFRESEQQAAYRASLQSLGSRLGGRLSVGPAAEPTAADIACLAADTNSDAAAVEAIIAELKEA